MHQQGIRITNSHLRGGEMLPTTATIVTGTQADTAGDEHPIGFIGPNQNPVQIIGKCSFRQWEWELFVEAMHLLPVSSDVIAPQQAALLDANVNTAAVVGIERDVLDVSNVRRRREGPFGSTGNRAQ